MFSLIVAMDKNGVIHCNDETPWRIPEDLEWFQKMTTDKIVIMGRETWDSLPKKPLPNRINVVLTLDDNFKDDRAHIVYSVTEALDFIQHNYSSKKVMVIGGADIYQAFSDYITKMIITRIRVEHPKDCLKLHTHFLFDKWSDWRKTSVIDGNECTWEIWEPNFKRTSSHF